MALAGIPDRYVLIVCAGALALGGCEAKPTRYESLDNHLTGYWVLQYALGYGILSTGDGGACLLQARADLPEFKSNQTCERHSQCDVYALAATPSGELYTRQTMFGYCHPTENTCWIKPVADKPFCNKSFYYGKPWDLGEHPSNSAPVDLNGPKYPQTTHWRTVTCLNGVDSSGANDKACASGNGWLQWGDIFKVKKV